MLCTLTCLLFRICRNEKFVGIGSDRETVVFVNRNHKRETETHICRKELTVVIATEGAWAPWTYHDFDTDELVGFDVEVARAIAAQLGVAADFRECPWESIFMGIDSKMYDIAANGVEITAERTGLSSLLPQPRSYIPHQERSNSTMQKRHCNRLYDNILIRWQDTYR